MSRKSIPLLCYWDGKISSGSQGITFEDANPKAIKVNRGVKHGELIDKICNLIGIDCTKYKLKIICRYLANGQYVALSIDDDESVDIMLDMTKEKGINCVELYIEKSYVFVRSQPDVHISVNDGGDIGARDPCYVYFTVKTLYGKFIPCRMKPDTPLEKLATAFSERENGMEHKFIFNGQQLDTQRSLNEYPRIRDDAVITALLVLRGD